MERFHDKIRRALRAMNQRGSLGQQPKAQTSNHKKIQQQSIKTGRDGSWRVEVGNGFTVERGVGYVLDACGWIEARR